jgi:hypothetical protein
MQQNCFPPIHKGKQMSSTPTSTEKTFAGEFLKHYLQSGIGSMSKTDIDALVMHLLDKHGEASGRPLGDLSNQVASERLRAPLAKIKRLLKWTPESGQT